MPMLQKASNVAREGSVLKSNGHRFRFSHHYFRKMLLSFQAKTEPSEIPLQSVETTAQGGQPTKSSVGQYAL